MIVFTLFLLPSCASSAPAEPTATAVIQADCFQSATAQAWLDADGDGVWDDDEQPLAGIEFVLEPTVYSRTISDENGVAAIFATTPGDTCPENTQVIASKFEGYTMTTPQTIPYTSPDGEYLFGFQAGQTAVIIQTETYSGAIFPAEYTAEFAKWLGEPTDETWTPTQADVTALEEALPLFLQANSLEQAGRISEKLSTYTRQYFGFDRAGERLVYANFFCDEMGADWMETAVFVEDGGDCYFQATHNTETDTFISFYVNGES